MFLQNRQTTYITDVSFLRKIYQDTFIHSFIQWMFLSVTHFISIRQIQKARPGETERFVSDLA